MNLLLSKPNFITNAVIGIGGVVTFDDDLKIVQINHNAEHILGYLESHLLGKSVTAILPVSAGRNKTIFSHSSDNRSYKLNKTSGHTIFCALHSTGQHIPIKATIFSITYDENRYFTLLFEKISSEKCNCKNDDMDCTIVNENIQDSKDLLATTYIERPRSRQVKKIGIVETCHLTHNYRWSDEFFEILELDNDSTVVAPDTIAEFTHPEDVELIQKIREKAIEDNSSYKVHHRFLLKNNVTKFIERRVELIYDRSGNLIRELELFNDITTEVIEEQSINETCKVLRAVLDTSHLSIALIDRDMNFTFVNKSYADLDNKEPEYFIGKNHFELYPNAENEKIFREVLSTGKKYSVYAKPFEYEHNPERGTTHWDWTLTPVTDTDGYVTGLLLSLQDVTERVNALSIATYSRLKLHKLNERLETIVEERTTELKQERAFINTVIESQSALVMVLNYYGDIVIFNKACEQVSEYSRFEAIGKKYWDIFLEPSQREEATKLFVNLLETSRPAQMENDWITKNGVKKIIEWSCTTIMDEKENYVQYIVMTGIDVTERRHTEKLLKRTSDTLGVAQQTTKIGSWEYEYQTDKLWWSDEYFEIFGLDPVTDIPSKELYINSIHEEDRSKTNTAAKQLKQKGYKDITVRVLVPDGDIRVIHEIAQAEFDKEGQPILLRGTVQDITDITKSEKERNQLQRQLQQAHKMESIGQLTGGIAHDFNNILAAILGFTRLASTRFASENEILDEYLQEIEKAGQRASNLVKQMLAFSRGDIQDYIKFDPLPIIKESIKMLHSTIPSSITISENLTTESLFIESNALQLQQAIVNLIVNARQALNGKGNIFIQGSKVTLPPTECVSCHKVFSGDYLVISVKDTAGGIDPEIISNIFEPFFTTKPVGEGTGMGLSMVHGFLHSSGGHVHLEIEPGKTTTISLYFPICNGPTEELTDQQTDIASKIKDNKAKSYRILIVDDEETVCKYLNDFLTMHDYIVDYTTSSEEALDKIKENVSKYDLLITDQSMPKLTGDELIEEVRKIKPTLPVILCTGYYDDVTDNSFDDNGTTFFTSKPINQGVLVDTVNHFIENFV